MKNIKIVKGHTLEEYTKKYGYRYFKGKCLKLRKEELNNLSKYKSRKIYWEINKEYYEVPSLSINGIKVVSISLVLGVGLLVGGHFIYTNFANHTPAQLELNKINDSLTLVKDCGTKLDTPHDAIKYVGDEMLKYYPTLEESGEEYIYDNYNKVVLIAKGDKLVTTPKNYKEPSNKLDLWKFSDTGYDANLGYSQYILEWDEETQNKNASNDDNIEYIELKTGIDLGSTNEKKNIKLEDSSLDIVIRTTGETNLEIKNSTGDVKHYGSANNVIVTGSKLEESAAVTCLTTTNSTLTLTEDTAIDLLNADEDSSIEISDAAVIDSASGDNKAFSGKDIKKTRLVEIKNYKDFVTYLTGTEDLKTQEYDSITLQLKEDIDNKQQSNELESIINVRTDIPVYIDFNGHTVTDNIECNENTNETFMNIGSKGSDENEGDCTVYFLDSSTGSQGGINLTSRSIDVNNDEKHNAFLYIESGNYTKEKGNNPLFRCIGLYNYDPEVVPQAFIGVYGGTITDNVSCIFLKGSGSDVYIEAGELNSNRFCVSGNGLDNTYTNLEITGGKFVCTTSETEKDNACIYQPQYGHTAISGGTFVGYSCIGIKSGMLDITGGTFTAYGDYVEKLETSTDGINLDGSVIVVDSNSSYKHDDTYEIIMSINDATMTSKHGNILREIGSKPEEGEEETTFIGDARFTTGTYTYNHNENPFEVRECAKGNVKKTSAGIWNYNGKTPTL